MKETTTATLLAAALFALLFGARAFGDEPTFGAGFGVDQRQFTKQLAANHFRVSRSNWTDDKVWDWSEPAPHHEAAVIVRCGSAGGTGVKIKHSGPGVLTLTNEHVIDGGGQVTINGGPGPIRANVLGRDPNKDLALLYCPNARSNYDIPVGTYGPPVGAVVEVLGFGGPLHNQLRLRHFVGRRVRHPYERLSLDTASISGDSGAAMVWGKTLVGINYGCPGKGTSHPRSWHLAHPTSSHADADDIRAFLTQYCPSGCLPVYSAPDVGVMYPPKQPAPQPTPTPQPTPDPLPNQPQPCPPGATGPAGPPGPAGPIGPKGDPGSGRGIKTLYLSATDTISVEYTDGTTEVVGKIPPGQPGTVDPADLAAAIKIYLSENGQDVADQITPHLGPVTFQPGVIEGGELTAGGRPWVGKIGGPPTILPPMRLNVHNWDGSTTMTQGPLGGGIGFEMRRPQ